MIFPGELSFFQVFQVQWEPLAFLKCIDEAKILKKIEQSPKIAIGGSRGACLARAPHLPGILVFETYFFQFHALFT